MDSALNAGAARRAADRGASVTAYRVSASPRGHDPREGWLTFLRTDDLDRFEIDQGVILDAEGNVGVSERPTVDGRVARILLEVSRSGPDGGRRSG